MRAAGERPFPKAPPRAPSAGTRRARESRAVTAGDPPVPVKRKVLASAQARAAAGTPQRGQDRALHSPPGRPPQAAGDVTHSPRGVQRPTPRSQAFLPRAPTPAGAAYRVLSLWRGSWRAPVPPRDGRLPSLALRRGGCSAPAGLRRPLWAWRCSTVPSLGAAARLLLG